MCILKSVQVCRTMKLKSDSEVNILIALNKESII